MNIDFSQKLNDALLPYLALVVGLAFLLLMVVFRSVLVPLKAALGFLLSVVAALGAVVAVFQWGWLRPVRRRADRSDHEHDADLHDRCGLRSRHGLRGLPRHPDA